ncbi:hypothetical protein [Actinoplanes subtropicus]|uniref:hypothetical protein n=1 Tax=Actinoplanes subtropicus TaxID=543632 RepID=UPI00069182EA|nr:hypothetical protein [Actinoplanes subtropicus]
MAIKTLDELRQADERTLHFTPMGLGLGVQMRPDDAAEYQQKVVAQFDLDPIVAEGTRQSFEHLRTIYAYGVLCYEIYTLVRDQALLVIEQALRDRFVDFHKGAVTFVDNTNSNHRVPVSRYEDVQEFLTSHRQRGWGWRLRLPNGDVMAFAGGMLGDLRTWARKVGLLRGQRNRGIERALSNLRNFVAHPTNYHLGGPVETAGTMRDLAEIINQLWGVPTPGGRLYPAPQRREVTVMTWPTDGKEWYAAVAAEAFTDFVDPDDRRWECVILRAVFRPGDHGSDPELSHYDSRAEVTRYPTELLWGPGSVTDAAAWFSQNLPEPDECDYLDRIFLVRRDGANLYLPTRPEVAAALPDQDRTGTWYTVKADHPNDAYHHVRNRVAGTGCQGDGECRECHAESLGSGPLHTALVHAGFHADLVPTLPNDVTLPWSHPRFQQIT